MIPKEYPGSNLLNYHGTPMMPFKPLKFEPFKKEPVIINRFKMY